MKLVGLLSFLISTPPPLVACSLIPNISGVFYFISTFSLSLPLHPITLHLSLFPHLTLSHALSLLPLLLSVCLFHLSVSLLPSLLLLIIYPLTLPSLSLHPHLFVCLSFFLSLWLLPTTSPLNSPCLEMFVSLSVCMFVPLSLSLSLSVPVGLCLFLCLCLPVSPCAYVCVCGWGVRVSLSFSILATPQPPFNSPLSRSFTFSLLLPISLPFSLTLFISL